MRMKPTAFLLLLACILFACRAADIPSAQPAHQGVQQTSATSSYEQVRHKDPIKAGFIDTPQQLAAWEAVTQQGRYRWAQPEDFRFSEGEWQSYKQQILTPFEGGSMNHDGAYRDFAVILVDTTREDRNRYSLVTFSEHVGGRGEYLTQWLYRDADLSRTILEWSSSGLVVRQIKEDGTHLLCFVEWDAKSRKYSCGLKPVARRG